MRTSSPNTGPIADHPFIVSVLERCGEAERLIVGRGASAPITEIDHVLQAISLAEGIISASELGLDAVSQTIRSVESNSASMLTEATVELQNCYAEQDHDRFAGIAREVSRLTGLHNSLTSLLVGHSVDM